MTEIFYRLTTIEQPDSVTSIPLSIYDEISVTIEQTLEQAKATSNGHCVVIKGVAGCGKSHFATVKILESPPYVDQDGNHIPRALIQIPSETTLLQLLRSILISLSEPIVPIWHGEPIDSKKLTIQTEIDGLMQRVIDVIQLAVDDYIILDDFHYLDSVGNEKTVKYAMDAIAEIISRSGKCFVLMGLPDQMDRLISKSLRLRIISSVVDFQPFHIDWTAKSRFKAQISEFDEFVSHAANMIGIQITRRTKREKLLERIYTATKGTVGNMINLFIFAEGRATQLEQTVVDLSILAWAYDIRLSHTLSSESAATSNPFKREFDAKIYEAPNISCNKLLDITPQTDRPTAGFIRRVEPFSDETFLSWLLRVVVACRYMNLEFILRFFRYTLNLPYLSQSQVSHKPNNQLVNLLSQLARIPVDDLSVRALANRWFRLKAEYYSKDESTLKFSVFSALVNDYPRICIKCLEEAIYIRDVWHLDPYCICHIHGTWLQDSCTTCGQAYNIEDIIRDRCQICGEPFSKSIARHVENFATLIPYQNRLVEWIDSGNHDVTNLQSQSFNVIAITICGLVDAVKRQDSVANICPSVQRRTEMYQDAVEILDDPTTKLMTYLSKYRIAQPKQEQYGFEAEFGILYSKWLVGYWCSTDFRFIHDVFNRYLNTNFIPYNGITRAKWFDLYPDFWQKTDFISVASVLQKHRTLKLSTLLQAIDNEELNLYVAPDSYSQFVRKSNLTKWLNLKS